jgi:hypothetical protein
MNRRSAAVLAVLVCLLAGFGFTKRSKTPWPPIVAQKGTAVFSRATGTFEVKLAPQAADFPQDPTLGRMILEKQIHGDLEATSKGEMLTGGTDVKGSGVYVAVERITGKLAGRHGSFLLHHTGIMTRGEPHLEINVVPDSGSGELAGISGKMNIIITEGKHSYNFDYSFIPTP